MILNSLWSIVSFLPVKVRVITDAELGQQLEI